MARYLLIEFDNDDQCEALKTKIDSQTAAGKPFRVAGLFARPTIFCSCTQPDGYKKNQVVQGGKYGWWVCRVCKRPRLGSHQAKNLLNPRARRSIREYTEVVDNLSIFEVPTKNLPE